jgi:tRNA (guanine-N7-)-methyltransferase
MKQYYLSLGPLIPWRNKQRPLNWADAFGRIAPLCVEIGFGNGEFLVRNAALRTDRNYAGIELEWASVKRVLRRIAQQQASNVRIVQANAKIVFERLCKPGSIREVYSLFPPPWSKEKYEKHRLFSHDFLRLVNSRLEDGGQLRIVTDDRPYAEWIMEQAGHTGLEGRFGSIDPRFDTKYERKWRELGQRNFFELHFLKKEHRDIPLKEDAELRTHRTRHFDPEHFQPLDKSGPVSVVFKEFLYDPRAKKAMSRVVVAEEDFVQHFWIEIISNPGNWHIRPAKGCGIVPTIGVQCALDMVRDAAERQTAS